MENVEATPTPSEELQPKDGPAPQAPEEEQAPKKDTRQQHLDKGVEDINEKIGAWNARFQLDALEQAAEKPRKIMALVDRLNSLEPRIRKIVGRLDLKSRSVFCALFRFQALDGQSIGCDFGIRVMVEFHNDCESVDKALEELPDDADVQFLAKANSLASHIDDLCENREVEEGDIETIELANVSAPGAPATEEPEAPVEEVAETQEAEGEETDQAAPAATESPTQEAISIHKRQPCTGEILIDRCLFSLSTMPSCLAMIGAIVENNDLELKRKIVAYIQPIIDEIIDPDSAEHAKADPDDLIGLSEWDQWRKKRSQAQPEEPAEVGL